MTTEHGGAALPTTAPGNGLVNGHPAGTDGSEAPSEPVKSAPLPAESASALDEAESVAVKDANPRTEQAGPKAIDAMAYDRNELDWYTEPRWCVDLLIEAERYAGRIWDPCCGHGTIGRAFADVNHPIKSTDVAHRNYGLGGIDFLAVEPGRKNQVDHIVCNPPFKLIPEFLAHGLRLAQQSVTMLVRLSWLASEARQELFAELGRPARVYVLANRASMPPGQFLDGETGRFICDDPNPKTLADGSLKYRWRAGDEPANGTMEFCWVVFLPGFSGNVSSLFWLSKGGRSHRFTRTTRVKSPELARGGAR